MSEWVLILAALAQHSQPRLASDAPVPLRVAVTLRPKDGRPMVLERR